MFRKKIPFQTNYSSSFLQKFRIWPFLNYLHDSNSIFWAQGIKSEGVFGRTVLTWFKSSPEYRALDRIDGEPMEFEWNIFPGFTTLELCTKVQELLSRLSVTPEKFTGRIIFMSMFNDISCGSRDK